MKLITAMYETGVAPRSTRDYRLNLVIPPDFMIPNFSICTLFEQQCALKVSFYYAMSG